MRTTVRPFRTGGSIPNPLDRLGWLLGELRRRNVVRVAIVYVAVVFVALQAVDLLVPSTNLPTWSDELLVALAMLGFPIALVVAWAFELTPEGIRGTAPRPPESAGTDPELSAGMEDRLEGTSRGTVAAAMLAIAALGVVLAGGWYLLGRDGTALPDSSVAVLPFRNLGGEESAQFTQGIHDDLVTHLSRITGLRVASRTSVRRYADTEQSVGEIGSELGVATVLEGGVQQSRDSVRINVTLVNAATDRPIWSESFDRRLTAENLFTLQGELTRRIASALEARLTPEEEERLARPPTRDLEAYRLYLRGRANLDQRTEPAMRRALEYFERAIARDSGYALAWAGIADALYELSDYGFEVPSGSAQRATEAAHRAVELEPELAEAWASLAMIHYMRQDGPAALRELERAIELRPGYAEAHNKLSWVAQQLGRPEVAFEAARRAVELDPLAPEPRANLAATCLAVGRPQEALAEARRMRELQPGTSTGRFYEAVMLHHLGRHEEAVPLLRGLHVPWAGEGPRATLGVAIAASGDTAAARDLLAGLRRRGAHPIFLGLLLAALGERGAALDVLRGVDRWTLDADWAILSARYFYPDALGPLRGEDAWAEMIRGLDRAWGLDPEAT